VPLSKAAGALIDLATDRSSQGEGQRLWGHLLTAARRVDN
jgi:hypothetical protein